MLVAASGVSSICFMNFSLQANSVGTYQLMKLLVIPLVIVMQRFFDQTADISRCVLVSLATLLAGVGLSTVTDVSLTMWGLVIGVLSVVCTAQFNIWQGSKQKVRAS